MTIRKTVDIADAIAAALTEEGWENVSRVYLVHHSVEALHQAAQISVIPQSDRREVSARGLNKETHTIALVYQKAVTPETPATVDEALADFDNILSLWSEDGAFRHAPMAGAAWSGTIDNTPLYDPSHLDTDRIVTATAIITYTIHR